MPMTVKMAHLCERIGFLWTRYREFVVYCLIGGCGVTLYCLVFVLLSMGLGLHYQLAYAFSASCGICNHLFLNVFFYFQRLFS